MRRLPKSFELGGNRWTVELLTEEQMETRAADTDCYGLCEYDRLRISVRKPTRELKASIVLQSFWHEFAHALLWTLQHKGHKNEKLVDAMGHALKQAHDSFIF